MKQKSKALNLIGLAQRANLLISGDERVEKALRNGQINVIICASDASSSTLKRYEKLSENYQLPLCTEFDTYSISQALGKKRSIVAITDYGMTQTFLSYFSESEANYDK